MTYKTNPFSRFFLLLKWNFVVNQKFILLSCIVGFLLLFIINTLAVIFFPPSPRSLMTPLEYIFQIVFTYGSCLVVSRSFKDIHTKSGQITALMLPGSLCEKFFARITLYVLGFYAAIILLFLSVSLLTDLWINPLLYSESYSAVNPFKKEMLLFYPVTLLLHSVYLYGAIFFKKHHFLKTSLVLISSLIFFAICGQLYQLLFDPYAGRTSIQPDSALHINVSNLVLRDWNDFSHSLIVIFVIAFFLILALIRLAEKEVRNGI